MPHLPGTCRRSWCDPLTRCLSCAPCSSHRGQRIGPATAVVTRGGGKRAHAPACRHGLSLLEPAHCAGTLVGRADGFGSSQCFRIAHYEVSGSRVVGSTRWMLCTLGCNTYGRCWAWRRSTLGLCQSLLGVSSWISRRPSARSATTLSRTSTRLLYLCALLRGAPHECRQHPFLTRPTDVPSVLRKGARNVVGTLGGKNKVRAQHHSFKAPALSAAGSSA